jgi:uncharacterized protein (TIGR03435 family)
MNSNAIIYNMRCGRLVWLIFSVAMAQKPLTFDAASVKPAVVPAGITVSGNSITSSRREDFLRMRSTGGPGTSDPGRIHYPLVSLKGLLTRAYDSYFEIKGPGWLDSEVVEVVATMPPETSREQFKEMLANLITERFKLKYHVEMKEIAGYALVVAKGGVKVKESAAAAAPDGFAIPPKGPTFMIAMAEGGRSRIVSQQQTLDALVKYLETMLKSRVVDETGLKAKYDYTLTYAGPNAPLDASTEPAEPDIFSALPTQLGLKLEAKKVSVETLVVDHMEKTPEN